MAEADRTVLVRYAGEWDLLPDEEFAIEDAALRYFKWITDCSLHTVPYADFCNGVVPVTRSRPG